jgi:branched-chain amino acid transport system permease protein
VSSWVLYSLFGVGTGGLYAALAIAMVLTYRGSGVVNFAQVAMATYPAFEYATLRQRGDLVVPFIPWHQPIHVASHLSFWPAFVVSLAVAVVVGGLIEFLVFRPLRAANQVAKVIASIGVSTALLGLINVQFASRRGAVGVGPVGAILPQHLVRLLGTPVSVDRFYLAGVVGLIGAGLWALYRWSWFGLATRAASESQSGAQLLGISPGLLSQLNWILAALVAATAGILAAPIEGVSLKGFEVFLTYALAAAMAAQLRSFSVATLTGVALGMFEQLAVKIKGESWMPSILKGGFETALPFVVIVVVLIVSGSNLPRRGALSDHENPIAPRPRYNPVVIVTALGVTTVLLGWGSSTIRLATIETLVVSVLSLSLVLMAGFVGQVTLAELTFAGIAAFALAHVATVDHLGFPWSPLVAIAITTVVATIISIPAVRVRGLQLVIVTYSGAIALEEVIFRNPHLNGLGGFASVPNPTLFGVALGPSGPAHHVGGFPYRPFGFFVLAVTVAVAAMVANIRRSPTGRRMLAVRANERAAAAAGINVARTKLTGAAFGAFVAASAGVLWAYKFIEFNNDTFPASGALTYIAVVYIGGISMISGAFVAGFFAAGGLFYALIGNGQGPARWQLLVSGVGMIVVTIRFPGGVAGLAARWRRTWLERRRLHGT